MSKLWLIAKDEFRLVENPDHIFIVLEVDTVFAADTGIDLCQQGARDKPEPHPPHVGRSDEAGNVANDSAADSDNKRRSFGPERQQLLINVADGVDGFYFFTGGDGNDRSRRKMSSPEIVHVGIGDDNGRFHRQMLGQILQSPTDHDHGIGGRSFYVHYLHKAFTQRSELFIFDEFTSFSAAVSSRRSVVSHEMHSSVMDTPYWREARSPLNF